MNIKRGSMGRAARSVCSGDVMYKCVFAAVTAAGVCVAASSALAQDASTATAGGDVTADEATPLPPVVVQAPSEAPRKTKRQIVSTGGGGSSAGASAIAGTTAVEGPAVAPFTLGQLDPDRRLHHHQRGDVDL